MTKLRVLMRWGDYSGLIQVGPKCSHLYTCKREAEGDHTHTDTHTHARMEEKKAM